MIFAHLKEAALGLLPSQTAELASQQEKVEKLQREISTAEQACAGAVTEWEDLLQQRVDHRKELEDKRDRFGKLLQSVVKLECEITEALGSLKKDESKLQETEKVITDFARKHGISAPKLS